MEKTDNRWVTGRCVADWGDPDIYYTTVAEALKWDKPEELVQLVRFEVMGPNATITSTGYQLVEMRISGNNEHLVLTTTNQEEALQMWARLAFGVEVF